MAEHNGTGARNMPDEEMPLIGGPKPPGQSLSVRTKMWMFVNVSRDWADLILLSCYLITGLVDSAANSVWASFVSMQTGMAVLSPCGNSTMADGRSNPE
jgi:hypothetical protein